MEQSKELKPKAQTLSKKATKEENLLWYNFLRLYKPQFRRQYVIGNYIVDFYCHKAKLVIELDGSQHSIKSGAEDDFLRDEYLNDLGITVLRYSNIDVCENFEGVCSDISRKIDLLSQHSTR